MKYMGSKARFAKHILPIVLEGRTEAQTYVEPFAGGMNMIDKVDGKRIANDIHTELIEMWKALVCGWQPPLTVTEDWRKRNGNFCKLHIRTEMKKFIIFSLMAALLSSCQYFVQEVPETSANLVISSTDDCDYSSHISYIGHNLTWYQDTAYTQPWTNNLTFKMGLNNPVVSDRVEYPHVDYHYTLFYNKELGNGMFAKETIEKVHGVHFANFDLRPIQTNCPKLQMKVYLCNAEGSCVLHSITTLMDVRHPVYCCD